jgi:hypothetical protein
MAAGLTDRVWTLREVLMFRVPPWPQPQAVSAAESVVMVRRSGARVPSAKAYGLDQAVGTRCERS